MRPGPEFQKKRPNNVGKSSYELQQLFLTLDILGQVERGQLAITVLNENPPDPRYGQPAGTVSQMVGFYRGSVLVARAHRFVRPPPEGPTMLDPKMILIEGTTYYKDI